MQKHVGEKLVRHKILRHGGPQGKPSGKGKDIGVNNENYYVYNE